MAKQDFQATQGLLHDDMRKQAGRIEKSWLEAVMNSVDAGASKVELEISENSTLITDDGSGMTEEQIDKYFRQFGFKDEDVEGKTFGKFRRGRGQIFNFGVNIWHTLDNFLIVNLEEDETVVDVPLDISPDSEGVISVEGDEVTLDTEGLSYNHQKAQEHFDGTQILVKHFKPLENVDEKVSEARKLVRYISWMHDIEVVVNGETIEDDFTPRFETDHAFYDFGDTSYFTEASVYNLGAYVDDMKVTDELGNRVPIQGVVVSKMELDLNNARTEIIEGDDVWETIKSEYIEYAVQVVADKDEPETREKKWLLQQCQTREWLIQEIANKPIMEDINGDALSLADLAGSKYSFAPAGNAVAKEAMDRKGIVMIDDTFESAIKNLPINGERKDYEDVVEGEFQFEMKERDEGGLSKRRKENLNKIRWFLRELNYFGTVKPGFSRHQDVWKDDEDTIYVDEDFLNAKKNVFVTEVIDEVMRVAAHDGDSRKEFTKNSSFYRQYYRYAEKAAQPRLKLLSGSWQAPDDRSFQ